MLCKKPTGLPPASWDFLLCYVYLKYLFPLFQWHACKLAKLGACIAKCMTTTINEIYITLKVIKGRQTNELNSFCTTKTTCR